MYGEHAGNGFFQIGKVVEQSEDDYKPEEPGLGWVCVEIGHANPEVYWMRMVLPYASKEFGVALYPELGDQVLTVQVDKGEYLCLGCLYHKTNKAKISNDDGKKYGKNYIKELRTIAGTAITINDEKDKEYVFVDVKEGVISLKLDVGGKSIVVDGSTKTETITVSSKNAVVDVVIKDATVKATDAVIEIKGSAIDMKCAKLDIKVDGAVNLKAGGKIVIKGSAVDIC